MSGEDGNSLGRADLQTFECQAVFALVGQRKRIERTLDLVGMVAGHERDQCDRFGVLVRTDKFKLIHRPA